MQGLTIDAQRAMQFPRSTPGVTTTLVGMKSVAHVEQNPAVAAIPLRRLWSSCRNFFVTIAGASPLDSPPTRG
jgi:hypothetical protein